MSLKSIKNKLLPISNLLFSGIVCGLLLILPMISIGQQPWPHIAEQPATLGLDQGFIELSTPLFDIKLVKASQTIAAMMPKDGEGFDYTPADRLEIRSRNNLYHLGDLTMRLRIGQSSEWIDFSTAANRAPVKALSTGGAVLASADLGKTLPADIPLQVIRNWEMDAGDLVLRFHLKNKSDLPVEIGSLGIPMVFNNLLHGKSLDQAHAQCVFYDPYIGQDAGYLQVVRLHGQGPVLLVVPHENAPFEAYNPLLNDPTPKGVTFEGFHEWMIHSKGHSETDWSKAEPWNQPTSFRLNPGEQRSYAVKFVQAESLRAIEPTLIDHQRPVAVGIPGYVIPTDVDASLFLNYPQPVRSIDVAPAGAISIIENQPTSGGWKRYQLKGIDWGRARITVTYADGLRQTINYNVIKPETQVIADMGRFMTNEQWYDNADDLFGRSPSVMTFDYETMKPVVEDSRAWIAGLSDEGGAGSWLGAIMKQLIQPERAEMDKLQRFLHETMWGGIQYSEGDRKYGVRKSLFFYEPDGFPEGTYSDHINYGSWSAWNRKEAESTGRSYNYPHVAAAHWVFYRLSRYATDYVQKESWQWYLENAGRTSMAMVEQAPHYAQYGQMEGTIFLLILLDLQKEGMTELAGELEAAMKERADLWNSLAYPFGSEMPWDSTGQEEVYAWSKYFGYDQKAQVTLNAILAYMPTVPHWGYNGSARRYWDFVYAGKLTRIERQLHHYGSGLNAIPVLSAFRENPTDLYMLRVGHAGVMGTIANITQEGFAPAAFHSFPSTLKIDGINGDYGPGFLGYSINSSSYVMNDKEFGWLSFSANLEQDGRWVTLIPTNASRSRVYLSHLGLWLSLDAGKFERVEFNTSNGRVRVFLDSENQHVSQAYLHIDQPAVISGIGKYYPKVSFKTKGEALIIPLKQQSTMVELRHK